MAVLNIAAPIGIACVASISNRVLHESWSGSQKKNGIYSKKYESS